MALLLVGPPLPPATARKYCVTSITLPGRLRLILNCDSPTFMRDARRPARLLEAGSVRQSRPVFVLAGTVAGAILSPLARLLRPFVPQHPGATQHDPAKLRFGMQALLPQFLGYVAINIGLLLLTFMLYWQCVAGDAALSGPMARIGFWIGTLLIFNDVVRAFIWSPHTQMFNLVLPAIGVALILNDRRRSMARLGLYACGMGIGILAYAAWALLFPCLIIAETATGWRTGRLLQGGRPLGRYAVLAMLCALPTALWFGFLYIAVGSVSVPETSRYHEVVWIPQTLQIGFGAFLFTALRFLGFFLGQFLRQGIPAFCALGLAFWLGRPWASGMEQIRPAAFAASAVALVCIAFYVFIGWPAARLGYPAVVPVVILAGVVAVRASARLSSVSLRRVELGFMAIALVQGAYTLLKGWPLS